MRRPLEIRNRPMCMRAIHILAGSFSFVSLKAVLREGALTIFPAEKAFEGKAGKL